jgi:hypothetical protein
MAALLALGGILAALCLFRWARTLALFVFGAAVVWFALTVSGHAQRTPMVECTVGTRAIETTDAGCDLVLDMFSKMSAMKSGRDMLMDCITALGGNYHSVEYRICYGMVEDIATQRQRRIPKPDQECTGPPSGCDDVMREHPGPWQCEHREPRGCTHWVMHRPTVDPEDEDRRATEEDRQATHDARWGKPDQRR